MEGIIEATRPFYMTQKKKYILVHLNREKMATQPVNRNYDEYVSYIYFYISVMFQLSRAEIHISGILLIKEQN